MSNILISLWNLTLICAILVPACFCASVSLTWRCSNLTSMSSRPTFGDEQSEKCYQIIDNEMHWEEAQIQCTNLAGPTGKPGQGKLASFDTRRSLASVRQWLRDINWYRQGIWIGARRCGSSPTGFCWANDSPVSSSLVLGDFWAPTEPSTKVLFVLPANCVQLRRSSSWRAHTYPCHTPKYHYSFICEFPMLPLTTTSTTTTTTSTTTSTTTALPIVADLVLEENVGTTTFIDPLIAAMAVQGSGSSTTFKPDSGVSMLLVGLFSGFGGALLILILVLLIVWRRCRPPPPTASTIQVVFTPVAGGNRKKGDEESIDEEIAHNRQVEMAIQMKQHPAISMAELAAKLNSPPRSPPPAYRAIAAPGEDGKTNAVVSTRTKDTGNRSILVMANECPEVAQDNIYAVPPGAL